MSSLLVTQARGEDRYGSQIDYLEDSLICFFSSINVDLRPIPNSLNNVEKFLEGIDYNGLVISGGGDVHPKYLSGSHSISLRYSKKRDSIENELIDLCLERKKMVLGICYGMQKLNTYFGGGISVGSQLKNNKDEDSIKTHPIFIDKSLFGLQGEYFVNQFHNITISKEDLAPSLKVVAIDSISGGVEAFIHSKFPILGIQWHPDRKSPDPKFNKELISMFLKAKSWNKHHEN